MIKSSFQIKYIIIGYKLNRVSGQSDVLPCAELNPFPYDLPQFSITFIHRIIQSSTISIKAIRQKGINAEN